MKDFVIEIRKSDLPDLNIVEALQNISSNCYFLDLSNTLVIMNKNHKSEYSFIEDFLKKNYIPYSVRLVNNNASNTLLSNTKAFN